MAVNLSLTTYNCKHFGVTKHKYIKDLLVNHDFILLQEHCLFASQFSRFSELGSDIAFTASSAMTESVQLVGRPYGGTCILWKSRLKNRVDIIKCTSSRLCAVSVNINESCNILLINVYMPCDDRKEGHNLDTFRSQLDEINFLVQQVNPTYFIVGGDLNTDFRRDTLQTRTLSSFLDDEALFCPILLNKFVKNIDYTYCNADATSTSIIDHFLICSTLYDVLVSYEKVSSIDNLSDHDAVTCSLSMSMEYCIFSNKDFVNHAVWSKASEHDIQEYKRHLDLLLNSISIPNGVLNCNDLTCVKHSREINVLYHKIVNALTDAANTCIPRSKPPRKQTGMPGWDEHVEPLRQQSLFWHDIWKENGCPKDGVVADLMRHTRAKYHAKIKWLRRNILNTKKVKMAEAVALGTDKDFWAQAKRIKGCNKNVPQNIDGISGDGNIANLFATKFGNLYNSVPSDREEMSKVCDLINNSIRDKCSTSNDDNECHLHVISVHDVVSAVVQMKSGKSDGVADIYSDGIIHGTAKLYELLSVVLTMFITHGTSSDLFINGTMVPLPKNKGTNKSDEFRAITLSSVIGKLFDKIVLCRFNTELNSSNLQYGFKEGFSTTACTFAVQEVVAYYHSNNTPVLCTLLDASKAFDKLEYCKLFSKLLKRNICPLVLRLLMCMYTNQQLQVRWNTVTSTPFGVSNGVKQGGVISPVLFCIYVDDLLEKLKCSGSGCHIGSYFAGAFAYADDIILLCPSVSGTKHLLSICEEYAGEHKIVFNATKSRILVSQKCSLSDVQIKLGGELLKVYKEADHLGHHFITGIDGLFDIDYVIKAFNRSVNGLLADYGFLNTAVLYKLFVQHCTSFYGIVLCNINSKAFGKFCVAWRRAIRRVNKIPPLSHNKYVCFLNSSTDVTGSVIFRVCRFLTKCMVSDNTMLSFLTKICCVNTTSNMGRNIVHIQSLYNIDLKMLLKGRNPLCKIKDCQEELYSKSTSAEDEAVLECCRELIECRDDTHGLNILNTEDCTEVLNCLLTS